MASRAAVAPFERMRTMYMADTTQTSVAGAALLCKCKTATSCQTPSMHESCDSHNVGPLMVN